MRTSEITCDWCLNKEVEPMRGQMWLFQYSFGPCWTNEAQSIRTLDLCRDCRDKVARFVEAKGRP